MALSLAVSTYMGLATLVTLHMVVRQQAGPIRQSWFALSAAQPQNSAEADEVSVEQQPHQSHILVRIRRVRSLRRGTPPLISDPLL